MNRACISGGNSKLGSIPNISLIPGKDCGNVPCKRDCYALKAWRAYPSAKRAWTSNSRLAHKDSAAYFQSLRDYLERKSPKWFRWHVAGDILSQEYLEQMKAIAVEFPRTRFLAFTKRHDLSYSKLPANMAIVFSMWPGWGRESVARQKGLPIAWMDNGQEHRIPNNAIECPGNCEKCAMCWNLKRLNRDVFFAKH